MCQQVLDKETALTAHEEQERKQLKYKRLHTWELKVGQTLVKVGKAILESVGGEGIK